MISAQILVRAASTVTRANDKFSRYGPLDKHIVRQPDVTGQSYAEQARKAREMLRSMDPEKVKQVIEFHRDLNLFQALALAKREGRLIVPNDVHDRILTETKGKKDKKYFEENYPLWTGTLVIYEAPDEPFGKQVVFEGITFKVPKQFRGKVNCALVVEHPDFDLVDRELVASSRPTNPSGFVVHFSSPRKIGDLPNGQTELGNNRYELKITDEKIHQVESFAKEEGWHLTDHGIPIGAKVDRSMDGLRYLWRSDRAYLGPVARGFDYVVGGRRQFVGAGYGPTGHYGVALVPLAAASKNE